MPRSTPAAPAVDGLQCPGCIKPAGPTADSHRMVVDLVLFGVLMAFALLGAWRGAAESGLKLLSLAFSYGVAVLAARNSGPALAEALGLAPLVGMPLAGTLGFVASHLAFSVAIIVVRRSRRDHETSTASRALGAVLGVARGGVFVVLLGWLGLLAGALRTSGAVVPLPDAEGSNLARWSGRVVETAAVAALGDEDPAARLTVGLVARPTETVDSLRRALAHPRIVALQQDAIFWQDVQGGAIDAAMERRSFQEVSQDASLRGELAALGLLSADSAASPDQFRSALRPVLGEVAERLGDIQRDPELRRLLEDPAVVDMLQRGDTLGLLSHAGFRSLVGRMTAS